MESTKEVLVRRSNNLFAPFTSSLNIQIDVPFSWRGTDEPLMTCTVQKDGNIRMKGIATKGTGGNGYALIINPTCGLVFKAGKTYNFSINPDCHCTMQVFQNKNGVSKTIYQFSGESKSGITKTFTEDTIPTNIFMNFTGNVKAGDEIDVLINPMLVEGDTKQDYEPYYHEYESTKEVLVRRSNNLLLPFSSDVDTAVGKNKNFSYDSTLFVTVETNGNIHIHGTKSVADSGWYLISDFTSPLVLKAGKTYSFKCNQPYGNCILQSTVSGSRQNVIGNYDSVTPTIDTPITHLYIDMNLIDNDTNISKEYDFYINPMLVEGDTKQDYEPYYYEAEASKTGIYPTDTSLTSIVDFSGSIYNKILLDSGNLSNNDIWATTKDLTPCVAGTTYWYKANMLNNTNFRQARVLFYDSNKNVIGKKGDFGASWGNDKSVVAPEGAVYMRIAYSRMGTTTDDPFPINPIIYVAETTQEEA